MKSIVLHIDIVLEAPILTRVAPISNFGVNAFAARNHQGKLFLPFSLVKGKTRQSWKTLQLLSSKIPDYRLWLGKDAQSDRNHDWTFERARLHFSDFVCEELPLTPNVESEAKMQTRIQFDDERLAIDNQSLMFYEVPIAVGSLVTFSGEISFLSKDDIEIEEVSLQVERALHWTKHFGSGGSVGWGKRISSKVTRSEVSLSPTAATNTPETIGYTLTFEQPFCVAKAKGTGNIFESDDFIKGSVVRGTLASMLTSLYGRNTKDKEGINQFLIAPYTELAKHFNDFRIRHAYPTNSSKRPTYRPLTAVFDEAYPKSLWDVALCDKGLLFENNTQGEFLAPTFATDWKDVDFENSEQAHNFKTGTFQPSKELRIRTSINEKIGRVKDRNQFAYECIVPKNIVWSKSKANRLNDPVEIEEVLWKGVLDFTELEQNIRDLVFAQLKAVTRNGLFGIGKTKARAKITFHDTPEASQPSSTELLEYDKSQYYILTLQSNALMFDPSELNQTSGHTELMNAYKAYFDDISSGTFYLERFFAEQDLEDGYMLQRKGNRDQIPYNPFVLTLAGSVFVLKVLEENKAKDTIEVWMKQGLPLASWVEEEHGTTWEDCAYLREDGFGEIAVNLEFHTSHAASKASTHQVEVLS